MFVPKIMTSDNASTLMAAANHIKRLFESDSLQSTLSHKGTQGQFIMVWRLVGTTYWPDKNTIE
jgi:hypothetical protein